MEFANYLKTSVSEFEERMEKYFLDFSSIDGELQSAILYALKGKGKRIRPLLVIECGKMFGKEIDDLMPYAFAAECIHTYSLIHDDLPCMDDDDLRRGRKTVHKVYGEAIAVLTGDALLNLAYEIIFKAETEPALKVKAGQILSSASGCFGMVYGQALDIMSEERDVSVETLLKIHLNKTGKLIESCVLMGAIIGGATEEEYADLKKYGENLGLLFQITDDILDFTGKTEDLGKSAGKDKEANKVTFVNFFSLKEAQEKAKEYYINAVESLKNINRNCAFFINLAEYVLNRQK